MAAPTNFRVEAQSMTTTVLRWSYSGSNRVRVYRSTDGSSYDVVEYALSTDTEYTDEDLAAGTKYWYKLSDDEGSTFSDVETVYTHFCADQNAGQAFMLPRFDDGQQDQSAKLNEMAERVERALGDAVLAPETCYVCPDAGTLVIDCTDGCNSFFVIADQDINSFTINRCGNSDPRIDIYVPPDTTRSICGFPPGYGFSGDECTEAPISGGSSGRTVSLGGGGAAGGGGGGGGRSKKGKPKTGATGGNGSGGGAGGSGCECVPGRNNELTLKCCTVNCSLGCKETSKVLLIKVCGGVGPYEFEHTGSVKFEDFKGGTQSDTVTTNRRDGNPQVRVVPPTNSGSAVDGVAYTKNIGFWNATCSSCNGFNFAGQAGAGYKCDDTLNGDGDCGSSTAGANLAVLDCLDPAPVCVDLGSCEDSNSPPCEVESSACNAIKTRGKVRDVRTQDMIDAGCNPCGLNQGATITVTDAAGVSVSITLQA